MKKGISALLAVVLLIAFTVAVGGILSVWISGSLETEYCSFEGHALTLADAKDIAVNSECGDRLKENYFCNEDTGTYWIDLYIEKEGCDPACVVYLVDKRAEINWRCMGVID